MAMVFDTHEPMVGQPVTGRLTFEPPSASARFEWARIPSNVKLISKSGDESEISFYLADDTPAKFTAMTKLKDWCKENQHRWLRWYIANGCELVECIEADEDNMHDYCSQLRITMIEPVVGLIDKEDFEGAYKVYKTMAGFQFAKYAPHILIPESFMMERKEAYAEPATA